MNLCPKTIHVVGSQKGKGGGGGWSRILAPFHENTASRTYITAIPTDRSLSQYRIRT